MSSKDLMEKLDAPLSNQATDLSDQELLHAKFILIDTKTKIDEIGRQIKSLRIQSETLRVQREKLQQQLNHFTIVLAPHKRLTTDVLGEIFTHCLPCGRKLFHPTSCVAPWSLGQVCQLWRNISRSDVRLWQTPLVWVERPRRRLILPSRVIEILPEFVAIDVHINFRADDFGEIWRLTPPEFIWKIQWLRIQLLKGERQWGESEGDIGQTLSDLWEATAPFSHFHRLKRVELNTSRDNQITHLLEDLIPWNQITQFTFRGVSVHHFQLLSILRKCRELQKLQLSVMYSEDVGHTDEEPLLLPSIDSFIMSFQFLPSNVLPIWHLVWKHLSTLHLDYHDIKVSAAHLRIVFNQCVLLRVLHFVEPNTPGVDRSDIVLPQLEFLTIRLVGSPTISEFLRVPSLKALSLITECSTRGIDFSAFCTMVGSSQCAAASLQIEQSMRSYVGSWTNNIYGLLSVMSNLVRVDTGQAPIDNHSLEAFKEGKILPRLEEIRCAVQPASVFMDMVEQRVLWESQQGGRVLRKAVGIIFPDDEHRPGKPSNLESIIRRLQTLYGVILSLEIRRS